MPCASNDIQPESSLLKMHKVFGHNLYSAESYCFVYAYFYYPPPITRNIRDSKETFFVDIISIQCIESTLACLNMIPKEI